MIDFCYKCFKKGTLGITLLHLALWAQLGVILRYWISTGLTTYCEEYYTEQKWHCMSDNESTRNFYAIMVVNMLGSFLMGLFMENRAHLLWFEAPNMPLSFLPISHPIQDYEALLTGLRVGLCGSLTTFSSWSTQMVEFTSEGAVFSMLFGFFVETATSLVSFVLGEQTAVGIHMCIEKHETMEAKEKLWHRLHQNIILANVRRAALQKAPSAISIIEAQKGDEIMLKYIEGEDYKLAKWEVQDNVVLSSLNLKKVEGGPDIELARIQSNGVSAYSSSPPTSEEEFSKVNPYLFWDIAFAVLLFLLTLAFAILLALDTDYRRRECWMSMFFAPLGCILRWKCILDLNGILKGKMAWFPLGTFGVNVIATVISCTSSALRYHFCTSAKHLIWVGISLSGLQTGFAGALSTVSTLMGELRRYMFEYPKNRKGWIYLFSTYAVAFGFGFGAYAWSNYVLQSTKCPQQTLQD